MKKILITGKNSYVGKSLEEWLGNHPDSYSVDSISLRNDSWKKKSFSEYDVVFHVAGIAHIKETKENAHLYYKVNRDLAYEVALKAKNESVKQFIFVSSMSVYGLENGEINKHTPLYPKSAYGKSKLEAEKLISHLIDKSFIVATIRPPMIYGNNCKGNYLRLASLSDKIPVFPNVENKRSMIFIDNLSEFVKQLIDNYSGGIFFPQNTEYVCTTEMVKLIAEAQGKSMKITKLFNPILLRLMNVSKVNKVFGDLVYEKRMSEYKNNYNVFSFKRSIFRTEGRN
jgi:nucleoside-diphosphate-sugar epimerase